MHFVCYVVVVVNRVIPHIKYQEVVFFLSVAPSSKFLEVGGSYPVAKLDRELRTG
jgi:hypothetical protein